MASHIGLLFRKSIFIRYFDNRYFQRSQELEICGRIAFHGLAFGQQIDADIDTLLGKIARDHKPIATIVSLARNHSHAGLH